MITTAFLNLLYWIISIVISPILLLSNVVLPVNFATSLATAGSYYHSLNTFLPIDTMLQILGISLTIELAYLIYKIVMWVVEKIPFIN